jgi:magnesium chelatase accessory protein
MGYYLDWAKDGRDWPNHAASRFVEAASMRWHVQVMGQGPALLLLHGTGAATHSWRDVMPKLAVAGLLRTLNVNPIRAVGHSAGAAVLVRMAVERLFAPQDIISFNGAFFPVTGVAGQFFSPLAKTFANATLVQKLFSKMADRKAVERLLRDTGSTIDAEGITLYQKLFSNEGHIAGTLGMMAAWDLHWVPQDLKNLPVPMTLVFASGDRTIPPARAAEAAKLVPHPSLIEIKGLGHLAHEEDPTGAAAIIADPASFVLR